MKKILYVLILITVVETVSGQGANKNLDFIVLNSLKDKGAGFKSDSNKISIINSKNKISLFYNEGCDPCVAPLP